MTSALKNIFKVGSRKGVEPTKELLAFTSCIYRCTLRNDGTFLLVPATDESESYTADEYQAIIEPVRNRKVEIRKLLKPGHSVHYYLCTSHPPRSSILEFYPLED